MDDARDESGSDEAIGNRAEEDGQIRSDALELAASTTLVEVPLRQFDWIARVAELATPALVLHGTIDSSAPIRLSQALRDRRPDIVTLKTFDADHTLAWNSDPERWRAVVSGWLTSKLAS